MLGQAQRPLRRLLGIAAAALVVLTLPGVGGADPSQSPETLQRENANLAAKSRAAVLSLYSLDSQLDHARARLADLQAQMDPLRRERASLGRQLNVARSGVTISQRRLAARLRMLYEQGDVSVLEVVLGAKTLDEALNGLDSLDRVASQDEAVLAQLGAAKRKLHGATRSLATRAAALEQATRDAAATTASLEATKAARSEYISDLAHQRSLNSAQISLLEAQSRAATLRSQDLARLSGDPEAVPISATSSVDAAPATHGGAITVTATGYALSGRTASGLPVGWGIAAVDPSVIPLGTHLTIPGYGDAVAADTGGSVVGSTIDLWFPSEAQAHAWGRRTVTITLR